MYIPVCRVASIEGNGAHNEPGQSGEEGNQEYRFCERGEPGRYDVDCKYGQGNEPALQDCNRVSQVFECRAIQFRVAVKISLIADLGPGRVDAQGEDAE